jgi:Family of unknown function (DUF5677)
MISEKTEDKVGQFLKKYSDHAWAIVEGRNEPNVPIDLYHGHVPSVLAGLLARQATLSIRLAEHPLLWDGHLATMVLRGMVECLVTLRWIVLDPVVRASEYVAFGLGQAKLTLSHIQKEIELETDAETKERLIRVATMQEAWIISQKLMPFVDVNLGSWTGSSIRKMCDEIGDEELYNFYFVPFSSSVHSTWQHVSTWNTKLCKNPLHMEHRLSAILSPNSDPMLAQMSARFLDQMVTAFDDYYGLKIDSIPAEEFFGKGLMEALSD